MGHLRPGAGLRASSNSTAMVTNAIQAMPGIDRKWYFQIHTVVHGVSSEQIVEMLSGKRSNR